MKLNDRMQHTLNIHTDGWGDYFYPFMTEVLLPDIFPHTTVTKDVTKPADFVIRSHRASKNSYSAPYITCSGEPYSCMPAADFPPLFDIDTRITTIPNSVWMPHLITEFRHIPIRRPTPPVKKLWCCAYSASHAVLERELVFRMMRSMEKTCYSFGRCSRTLDSPFIHAIENRASNYLMFQQFDMMIAMENSIHRGYLTEKIGHAFCAGTVPIYWGDRETAAEFFNPAAFIQVLDFPNALAAGVYAVEVWRDKQKLQKYLDAPITLTNTLAEYSSKEYRPWKKLIYDTMRDEFPDLS